MSDLERFRTMDVDEVHKKTFIAPRIIEALQNEDFKKLGSRARALGFIKIIEREMHVDLQELRQKVEQYYGDALDYKSAFVVQEQQKNYKKTALQIGGTLLLLVIAGAIYFFFLTPQKESPAVSLSEENITAMSKPAQEKLTDAKQESVQTIQEENSSEEKETAQTATTLQKADANQSLQETNTTQATATLQAQEANTTEHNSTQTAATTPKPFSLAIVPNKRIWVGIIYLDNHKRKVYSTSEPIELNTSRDQLIIAGHTRFHIIEDGEEQNISGVRYFLYREGKLMPLSKEELKRYNKGRVW